MKLAKQFKFDTWTNDGTIYVATEQDDGSYIVHNEQHPDEYASWDREDVQQNMVNAAWRVLEVVVQNKPSLKHIGKAITNSSCNMYRLEASERGDRYILVGLTGETVGKKYDLDYTEDRIDSYVTDNGWTFVEEVPTSLESSDAIVVDASNPLGYVAKEPEFLPPDDIEPIIDYGITLVEVQRFCAETGWTVEVDQDYFAFVYDGRVEYTVHEPEDMAAVMQAIRTLAKFSDKE